MVNNIYLPREGLGGTFAFYFLPSQSCVKIQTLCTCYHLFTLYIPEGNYYITYYRLLLNFSITEILRSSEENGDCIFFNLTKNKESRELKTRVHLKYSEFEIFHLKYTIKKQKQIFLFLTLKTF